MSSPGMSEAMKRRWADPEWRARQRKKISEGLSGSGWVSEAARKRRPKAKYQDDTQPWKPGDPKPDWLRRGR